MRLTQQSSICWSIRPSGEDGVSKSRKEKNGCRVFLFGLHDRSDFQIYAD